MYQPQRISESVETTDLEAPAAFSAPRRAARTRSEILRTRVVPAALSLAVLACGTAYAVTLPAQDQATAAVPAPERDEAASRDTSRELTEEVAPAEQAEANAAFMGASWSAVVGNPAGERFAHDAATVRAASNENAAEVASLKKGAKVAITDKAENGFRQVIVDGKLGWVAESLLGEKAPVVETPKPKATETAKPKATETAKPKATETAAPKATATAKATAAAKTTTAKKTETAPATSSDKYTGSTTYSGKTVLGLKPKAMVVYNAVTAKWSFSSIGGYRASSLSNHQRGGAIDFMLTPGKDSAKGWAVANFLAANMDTFDLDHIIFEQKIYTSYRRYWRPMENRGSITANHYDHVHVSVAGI